MTLALQQLERAAALNHSGAINALGWHSLEIKHNYTEAVERFQRAHLLGNKDASHNLGHIYYYGRNAERVVDRVSTHHLRLGYVRLILYSRYAAISQCFDTVGRQEGHLACKKTEWWGAGIVICLERGADLHMAQLIPLPLRLVLPFWYWLTWVVLEKGR